MMRRALIDDKPIGSPAVAGSDFTPSPFEIATGMLFGTSPVAPPPRAPDLPRQTLEDLIRPALGRPPCLIAFSGGRDSSALLAVALDLARRDGLAEPVAVTLEYESAATFEREWQDRVLGHLGLGDRIRLQISDELDFVGPVAAEVLRRHGPMYPANAHVLVPMAREARGGSLLTGVGGDDVFGNWPWHDTAAWFARRRRPHARDARQCAHMLSPHRVRTEVLRRQGTYTLPWIRAAVRREVAAQIASELSSAPRTWPARMMWSAAWRPWRAGAHSLQLLGADRGVSVLTPFLEPSFLAAMAHAGGRWGWGNRTDTMQALFSDLLPSEVITRRGKAEFSGAFFGPQTKRFAEHWDGRTGTDPGLTDPEALRQTWLGPQPHFFCTMALQAAWLATDAIQGAAPASRRLATSRAEPA